MVYKKDILLGQILKTSGFEGAVTVRLEKRFIENIPHMESVFIEVDDRPVPFFISELEYTGDNILKLKFDDYDTVSSVSEFAGCRIFLTGSIPEEAGNEPEQLEGYSVYNSARELIGKISGVVAIPGQHMLEINSPHGREILIPLHQDLILSIDDRQKIIIMEIPEGLTEIN